MAFDGDNTTPSMTQAPVFQQDDFPALGAVPSSAAPDNSSKGNKPSTSNTAPGNALALAEHKAGNVWGAKQNLFPNAPAAIAPPVDLLRSMTIKDKDEGDCEDPLDPDSRGFSAKKFYVDLLCKYRCPHKGCG
jgi:hypothetical protein